MASSGSYARGDQPRSVPDPDAEAHAAAGKAQGAYNARQVAELERKRSEARRSSGRSVGPDWAPDVGHPGEWEALAPLWGSGREALADLHDGDYLGAAGNGAMAVSDLALVKGALTSIGKGAVKVAGSHVWHTPHWEKVQGARTWMREKGYLKPGQIGHHGIIPQNGWGKVVPEYIKNQPWNIKALDPVTHRRIHGRPTIDGVTLPRFNRVERIWHGTPSWTKPAAVAVAGDAVRTPMLMVEKPRR